MLSGLFIFIVSFVFGAFTSYFAIRTGQFHRYWKENLSEKELECDNLQLIHKNMELKNKLKNAQQLLQQTKEENNFLFNEVLKKSI